MLNPVEQEIITLKRVFTVSQHPDYGYWSLRLFTGNMRF